VERVSFSDQVIIVVVVADHLAKKVSLNNGGREKGILKKSALFVR